MNWNCGAECGVVVFRNQDFSNLGPQGTIDYGKLVHLQEWLCIAYRLLCIRAQVIPINQSL